MKVQKIVSLAAVLGRSPREFAERVGAIAEGRLETLRHPRHTYDAVRWEDAIPTLSAALGDDFNTALGEPQLEDVAREVRENLAALRGGPINDLHNGDELLARCCYAVTRAIRPSIVIETGVAHGVSSAFFLAALAANGAGELHSIDLPPLDSGSESRIGACIPDRLRGAWTLYRGTSRRLLPELIRRLGGVDLFMHDSLHTYDNMRFEIEQAWPHARAIIADDIELNAAFAEFAARDVAAAAAVRQAQKISLFGVIAR
jgi:hypothetical protein